MNLLRRVLGLAGLAMAPIVLVTAMAYPPNSDRELPIWLVLLILSWALLGFMGLLLMTLEYRSSVMLSSISLILWLAILNAAHQFAGKPVPWTLTGAASVIWFYGWGLIHFVDILSRGMERRTKQRLS